jgi:hypothetical protein
MITIQSVKAGVKIDDIAIGLSFDVQERSKSQVRYDLKGRRVQIWDKQGSWKLFQFRKMAPDDLRRQKAVQCEAAIVQ